MKKRLCAILLTAAILLTLLPQTLLFASAEGETSGSCGADLTWTFDPETGELVISGTGAMFDYATNFNAEIYITTAPWAQFEENLKKVTFNSGITNIGEYAFRGCNHLTEISIPDTVTSISSSAFNACSGVKSVSLGNSVTSIGSYAFVNCEALTSITIPDSVTVIDDWAFGSCSELTEVTLGSGLTSIGASAFFGCEKLNSITIPDSTTTIEEGAFNGCEGLTNVTFGSGLTSIAEQAFAACTSLTDITIPEGVTEIGASAFSGCTSLTDITIPEGVTEIGANAFKECTGLTSITIPGGVTKIRDYVFKGCTGLTDVTIPSGVTSILRGAFSNCSSLTAISIPSGVTDIDSQAFYNCSALTDITIPDSVTSIGWNSFEYCTGLTSVALPEGLTYIGNAAFRHCTGLTSVQFPESLTDIGEYAFCDCPKLTSIHIPAGVTNIGTNAFLSCYGLTSITVDGDNPVYDSRGDCNALIETQTATLLAGCQNSFIHFSVTAIADYAFNGCPGLTSLTFSEDLPSIISGYSLTSIGKNAFSSCENLTSVMIPAGVTSIGYRAFQYCDELINVFYGGTRVEWDEIDVSANNDPLTSALLHCNVDDPSTHVSLDYITEPTCTEPGKKEFSCPCGFAWTEDIPMIPHDWQNAKEIPATCTEFGREAGVRCSCCGEYQSGGEDIFPLGHDYVDGFCIRCGEEEPNCTHENLELTGAKPFTCTEPGYTGDLYCVDCGELIEVGSIMTPPGHLYEEDITPPTCVDGGYTTYTCFICGDTFIADETEATGHDYENGICTVCGEKDPNYTPTDTDPIETEPVVTEPIETEPIETEPIETEPIETEPIETEPIETEDPCEGYTDLPAGSWYYNAAGFALSHGIMGSTKTDAKTFEPMTACTRSMIATMLYSLEGKPEVTYEAVFPDVKDGQWYTAPIMWAYQNGVVTGYSNGSFGPNDKITREQMAVILKAYTEKVKGLDTTETADLSKFADAGKVTWSKPYIEWAVAEGLLSGKAVGGKLNLDPQGNATRAEVAAIMMSFITKVVDE